MVRILHSYFRYCDGRGQPTKPYWVLELKLGDANRRQLINGALLKGVRRIGNHNKDCTHSVHEKLRHANFMINHTRFYLVRWVGQAARMVRSSFNEIYDLNCKYTHNQSVVHRDSRTSI